jgi:hypothetical protein
MKFINNNIKFSVDGVKIKIQIYRTQSKIMGYVARHRRHIVIKSNAEIVIEGCNNTAVTAGRIAIFTLNSTINIAVSPYFHSSVMQKYCSNCSQNSHFSSTLY